MDRWLEVTAAKTTSYTYDGLGRLTSEADPAITKAYTYDKANNRLKLTVTGSEQYTTDYSYDNNNRLKTEKTRKGTTTEETNYFYDPNGNQISKVKGTFSLTGGNKSFGFVPGTAPESQGNVTEFYSYDGFNRLTKAQVNGLSAVYEYRPDGLRLSKTINGQKTTHVWDGQEIVMDLGNNDVMQNRYIRGTSLIAQADSSSIKNYYLQNAHGDVVQLSNSSGSSTKNYSYDAFGIEKNIDSNDTNPFRYSGEYYDMETGNIYLRARYYDPTIGRMISQDGFGFMRLNDPLGLNLYTYCDNNPINAWDPTGRTTDWDRKNVSNANDLRIIDDMGARWQNATSQMEKDFYHGIAESIRNKYRSANQVGTADGSTVTKQVSANTTSSSTQKSTSTATKGSSGGSSNRSSMTAAEAGTEVAKGMGAAVSGAIAELMDKSGPLLPKGSLSAKLANGVKGLKSGGGLLAAALTAKDLYDDVNKYSGAKLAKAIGLTLLGTAAAVGIGIVAVPVATALGAGAAATAVGVAGGAFVGGLVSLGIASLKTRWLG